MSADSYIYRTYVGTGLEAVKLQVLIHNLFDTIHDPIST